MSEPAIAPWLVNAPKSSAQNEDGSPAAPSSGFAAPLPSYLQEEFDAVNAGNTAEVDAQREDMRARLLATMSPEIQAEMAAKAAPATPPAPAEVPAPVAAAPATPPPQAAPAPELASLTAVVSDLAKVVATLVPKPAEPVAAAPALPQSISREDLLRNPVKALKALGIDPAILEPAVNYARSGDAAPVTDHLSQKIVDNEDRIRQLEAEIQADRQAAAEARAQAVLESEVASAISTIPTTQSVAAKLAAKDRAFVTEAVTATIAAYRNAGETITPAQALAELNTRWASFAAMLTTEPPAPNAAPAQTATPATAAPIAKPATATPPPAPALPATPFAALTQYEADARSASQRVYRSFLTSKPRV